MVCDSFSNCEDGSDERNCSFIHISALSNETHKPPTEIKNGKIRPIGLNATFRVLEIFEINEVDSTFDIHFVLEIQWFHRSLNFEFLKLNDFENFLYFKSKDKIWIPHIEFGVIKRDLSSSKVQTDNVIVLRETVTASTG